MRIKIEMVLPTFVDPSTILERAQYLALNLIEDTYDKGEDDEPLLVDDVRDSVSVEVVAACPLY